VAAAYYYATGPLRTRLSDAGRLQKRQAASFYSGLLVLYVASSSPMHELSEGYLLSAHMIQHLLFTLVAAPLLLAGIPAWLWQQALRNTYVLAVAHFLTKPVLAFALFNLVLLMTHLPPVMDLALSNHGFHFFVHALLVATALLMWWPILSPVRELPPLSYPVQMIYLFGQSLLPSVLAAFVTFADRVVYTAYAEAPRLWGMSPIEDQQVAGGLMKVIGALILWSFIAFAFFRWYEKEQRMEKPPHWGDIEQELEQLGLGKRN